jgi:hypothetical protein
MAPYGAHRGRETPIGPVKRNSPRMIFAVRLSGENDGIATLATRRLKRRHAPVPAVTFNT